MTQKKEQMEYLPPSERHTPMSKMVMVGAIGFEPTTPGPPCQCATRLRHAPKMRDPHVRGNVYAIMRRYLSIRPLSAAGSPAPSAREGPAPP